MEENDRHLAPSTTNQYFIHPIGSTNLAHIIIPAPFFKRFDEEEHGKQHVSLISSQISGEWNVKREGDKLTDGWEEFTEMHNLRIGDYVIFKHRGNSVFEVTALGPSGCQLNYKNSDISSTASQAGNSSRYETQKQQHTGYAGTSSKRKKRYAMADIEPAMLSLRTKNIELYRKTAPEESNIFYQTVTETNVERNAMYFPKNFVNTHGLGDRQSYIVEITNEEGIAWNADAELCVDGRLRIEGGWSEFCEENNIQIGNRCKFKLLEDRNPIIIDLLGFSHENEMTSERTNRSPQGSVCKEDQCSSEGENTAENMTDTALGKGQS